MDSLVEIVEEIKSTLSAMADMGCGGFDCSDQTIGILKRWESPGGVPSESLTDIRSDLGDCTRCWLSRERRHIVFGQGDPGARLVFVGEGPGYDEDRQGEPFVGVAGRLLTRIIEAMNLTREQVYICNIVKCRPPGNRNPEPDEIQACLPFLKRQIAAIRPDFICALGTIAAQTLLETREPISRLRGRFHEYNGRIKVMPTYHPAYLLRHKEKKREVWVDVQKIMKALGESGKALNRNFRH